MYCIASAAGASGEKLKTFHENCTSKTMLLQRKLITESGTTSTMDAFSFDKLKTVYVYNHLESFAVLKQDLI